MVELEIVRKPSGPLLVAGLEREGITVFALEWFDVATRSCTELRLMVPRHQLAEATEVMDRLR
ncbi:MAG: hypothetical protein ABIV94_00895 [Acidimicrobiales bacterium]